MTLYEVLGISSGASAAEIKSAHREAVKTHHPDAGGDPASFLRVQHAYTVLCDPERRARYDSSGLEDEPTAAEDQQAYAAIASLLLQVAESADLRNTDVIDAVRKALREQHKAHTLARRQIEIRIGRIRMLRSRLHRSGDGEDKLTAIIAKRESAFETARTSEDDKLGLIGRALEILQHYTYCLNPNLPDEAAIWCALKS